MHKPLTADERARLDACSRETTAPLMTKKDKLMRLARLVREYDEMRLGPLAIFHKLEGAGNDRLKEWGIWSADPRLATQQSAFRLAFDDPTFRAAGLTPTRERYAGVQIGTLYDAINFLELTHDELHEFSCDCGGRIGKDEMARRIEAVANGGARVNPVQPLKMSAAEQRLFWFARAIGLGV